MKGKSKIVVAAVIIVLVAIIAALLVLLLAPKARKDNGVPLLNFQQGDVLKGYAVADEDGNELGISDIPGARKLLLFSLDTCGDCRAEYDTYRLLFAAYDQPDFNVAFIWDDRIPYKDLETLDIARGNSYTASGRYKFTDWVPTAMVVDAVGGILLKTADMDELVQWLAQEAEASSAQLAAFLQDRSLLLGIDWCGGCKAAREKLDAEAVQYVYAIQGNAAEKEEGVLQDPHGVLSAALGVTEYPALASVQEGALTILSAEELK